MDGMADLCLTFCSPASTGRYQQGQVPAVFNFFHNDEVRGASWGVHACARAPTK